MANKIAQLLTAFSSQLRLEVQEPYKGTQNTEIITKQLPYLLADELSIGDTYKVYGSVGSGNWSEIPWIGILDKSITTSTTKGYYLVILLDKKLVLNNQSFCDVKKYQNVPQVKGK